MNLLVFRTSHRQRDILIRRILMQSQLDNAARFAAHRSHSLFIAAEIVNALAVDAGDFIIVADARFLCRRIRRHGIDI